MELPSPPKPSDQSLPPSSPGAPGARIRQAAITVVYGRHPEELDYTFTSFAKTPFLELHAFVLGDRLPEKRLPGIQYHLKPFEPRFGHPMRDADFRRWEFIEELGVDYVLVVDGHDALCLRPLPDIPQLLRGAGVAGCVEHEGGRYMDGRLYTSNFLNAGVTFWHVPSTRELRKEVLERGRRCFRNLVDDQLSLNEILHTRYPDQLVILPCHYNYRAHLAPLQLRGWPTVPHLDGIRIYHNSRCIQMIKSLPGFMEQATPEPLPLDAEAITEPRAQWWRRLRQRLKPHLVR